MAACSHVAGNIIPDNGPTMESIYDDLGDPHRQREAMRARYFTDTSPAVKSRQSAAFRAVHCRPCGFTHLFFTR